MSAATIAPADFDYISRLVQDKSAIVLEKNKGYLVESRLSPLARECGLDTLERLIQELQKPNSQPLVQRVVEAMTTNETSFFRDLHPFQALKSTLIPELIEKRAKEKTLTIWSNACSSGQEVYTIAMILKEHFPHLAGWKVRLIASDLSKKILDKASEGCFSQTEVNRGLPMQMLMKYFTKDGMCWRLNEEIRKMVEFRVINLIEPFPTNLPKIDIVFLRNVLIYFAPETKTTILNKVRSILQKDGYLFLGGAETTMNLNVLYERCQFGNAVCYRPTN